MPMIRYTLVSDGTSDANLIPIIDWTLKNSAGVQVAEGVRAEFWRLLEKPKTLSDRLAKAVELFPCDVLFVHRDAEKEIPEVRIDEISRGFKEVSKTGVNLPAVAIIPVRMLEAWLCFDEKAIRCASGNPNGAQKLDLQPIKRIESRPDPKEDLKQALLIASELTGRRRKKFNSAAAFWRIVDFIDDFSVLRQLPSFQAFEKSVETLKENEWRPGLY